MDVIDHEVRTDLDWDAYRFIVALADEGTLLAASRRLKVSQPTVGRRLRELEEKLGVQLFEREVNGYVPSHIGESIIEFCREMSDRAIDIQRSVADYDRLSTRRVRVTTTEGLGIFWLAPKLKDLRARLPEVNIQILIGASQVDIMRKDADLALRVGQPGSDDLVGRKIGRLACGLYASTSYLQENGKPLEIDDLRSHLIIDSIGEIANLPQARHLRRLANGSDTNFGCNNLSMQVVAARAGLGLLALPEYVARNIPEFRRVLADEFNLSLDLWLLTRHELLSTMPVRTIFDFLSKEIDEDRLTLADEANLLQQDAV